MLLRRINCFLSGSHPLQRVPHDCSRGNSKENLTLTLSLFSTIVLLLLILSLYDNPSVIFKILIYLKEKSIWLMCIRGKFYWDFETPCMSCSFKWSNPWRAGQGRGRRCCTRCSFANGSEGRCPLSLPPPSELWGRKERGEGRADLEMERKRGNDTG